MKKTTKDKRTNLEREIDNVLKTMFTMDPCSEDYQIMVDNLETLYKLKTVDQSSKISRDTIAIIAGNLLGIGLIMTYEKAHVITTKAFGLLIRGRV